MGQLTTTHDSAQIPRFREAYQNLIDEIHAVPTEKLVVINIDIPTTVTTALGVLPEIRALRSRIATEMPQFDLARFDKLEAYTLALGHAHALYMAASEPSEALDELVESAAKLREVLVADATALAQRNLIDGERLRELKGAKGYRNLAFDLFALAAMMRAVWTNISGKTALHLDELDEAETLADRILTAVGEREQGPAIAAVSAENRQKAFTLFVTAYDQVRRAAHYLRWDQEDTDKIVPSLYAARTANRRKNGDTDVKPTSALPPKATDVEAAPKPGATNGSSGTTAPVGVGMPDSEPFAGA